MLDDALWRFLESLKVIVMSGTSFRTHSCAQSPKSKTKNFKRPMRDIFFHKWGSKIMFFHCRIPEFWVVSSCRTLTINYSFNHNHKKYFLSHLPRYFLWKKLHKYHCENQQEFWSVSFTSRFSYFFSLMKICSWLFDTDEHDLWNWIQKRMMMDKRIKKNPRSGFFFIPLYIAFLEFLEF